MIIFVRTTGGSELSLRSIVEAVEGEDGLVTLFLSDGEIRHAAKDEWERAVQYNYEIVMPAAPGTYLLFHSQDEDVPDIFRVPVIAWRLSSLRHPDPITLEGLPDPELSIPTILSPGGQVDNVLGHYETFELWQRHLIRMRGETDFEQGTGPRRAYHQKNGRVRRGEELNPYM